MPNNAAAQKRMRQEQKRRLHNRSVKSLVKTQITKARQAVAVDEDAEVRCLGIIRRDGWREAGQNLRAGGSCASAGCGAGAVQ